MNENIKLWFSSTIGYESHMNLLGKVTFFPVVVGIGVMFIVLDFFFTKQITEKDKE